MNSEDYVVDEVKDESPIVTLVKKRLARSQNFIGIFQGSPGVGKTASAISMAKELDPEFSLVQIVFNLHQMKHLMKEPFFLAKELKVILFDEPQLSLNNRTWQSKMNKFMNWIISTFRSKKICLLFATPYARFLDKQSMVLLHALFDCEGIDYEEEISWVSPKLLQYNPIKDKTYYRFLKVNVEGRGQLSYKKWGMLKPEDKFFKAYEQKKEDYLDKFMEQIISEEDSDKDEETLSPIEAGKQEPYDYPLNGREPLTEEQLRVMRGLSNHSGNEMAMIMNCKPSNITQHKQLAQKKGYTIQEFQNYDKKEAITTKIEGTSPI